MADLPAASPKVVLIVDDDQDLREILTIAIRKDNLRVETAKDGYSAIAQIPVLKPDLIVLDLMLPGVSGVDILEQLQAGAAARIPVVVVTGVVFQPAMRKKVLGHPDVVDFLEKPIKIDRLREAVLKGLARPAPET